MVAMSAVVYYVLPGLLGRAYDLKNDSVGTDLFLASDTSGFKTINRYMTTSEYRVVSELSEATDFLDVSGKLALKLKTGAINIEGTGKYLKESKNFENRVDLLIKVHYETVIETLPSQIKPRKNWQSSVDGTGMTHYIRSIVYGGDLIASVRFTTTNSADKEIIKAEVQGELNAASGSFGAGLTGNLDKIKERVGDSAFMDINYFATVPLTDIPRTIKGLSKLVDGFPEETKKINNEKGVPLSMEVFSLEALNRDIPTYYQTLALADQLVILDEMLSDIRSAKQRLASWLKTVPPVLSEEDNSKIGDFYTNLEILDRTFSKVISDMDLSGEATADQFKPAIEAYLGDSNEAMPNKYVKRLSKLKKEVLDNTKSFEVDFGGANFNYWGSNVCPGSLSTLYDGVMSSTDHSSVGSSEFTCMPSKRDYINFDNNNGNEEHDIEDLPKVQPVSFISRKTQPKQRKATIPCANCRIPGKSTVTTLIGTTDCPGDWNAQYTGVLISSDFRQARGDLLCLDVSKTFPDSNRDATEQTEVTEVSPKCDSFPCQSPGDESRAVPCVVCSKTKNVVKVSDYLRF